MRDVLLALHVFAGAAGLVLGPLVLLGLVHRAVSARMHRAEPAYLLAVGLVCVSALALVLINPTDLWWLGPVAVATLAAASGAYRLRSASSPTVRAWRARLLGGSYAALVTTLLVVSVGGWPAWLLPSVAGALVVERLAAAQGRYPLPARPQEENSHAT